MPGMQPRELPLLRPVPAAWQVPASVEVRRGTPKDSAVGPLVAFRNKRSGEATGVMASVLSEEKPLPEWLVARVAEIA